MRLLSFIRRLTILLLICNGIYFQCYAANQDTTKNGKADTTKIAKAPKLKPYEEIITEETKTSKGLFAVHELSEKYFLEIGDSLLARDLLLVTRISKAGADMRVGMAGYAGDQVNEAVIRLEKGPDDKLFMRRQSYSEYSKDSTQAMFRAVMNSNIQPIAAAFDIKAISADSAGSVIEVTEFLKGDNDLFFFAPQAKSMLKLGGHQADKSYIHSLSTYPENVEIKTVKTYIKTPSQGPTNGSVSGGTATMELNTSIVLLPAEPMQSRYADKRIGYFTVGYTDFDKDPQGVEKVELITRWRLEPKDWAAYKRGQLTEPVKPIVFYIDPATPKEWVPYLMQGVNDWQGAFEKAGFKNAIYALEAPTWEQDSTWSLEDARFSAIVYKASSVPNASGPVVADPRTGEILESHVNWYHNVMRLLRNWYMIQVGPNDKRARRMTFDDELMGQLIRFVSSHEVGHTLGLLHNFGASSTTPVEKLRDKKWVEQHGHTPSIMDYARFNYVAQPEDNISEKGLFPRIGDYDIWAIEWGYRLFSEYGDAESERPHLNKWVIEKNKDPRLWFGREQHPDDPRSQSEDMGNNAMLASEYGIKNLKRLVENLPEWTMERDKDYSGLREIYNETMQQYFRYVGHVTKNIGGTYETPKMVEQGGNIFESVPKGVQRAAVGFLNQQVFSTPFWLAPQKISRLIGGDPLSTIGAGQQKVLGEVLNHGRLQKLLASEALQQEGTYGITELFDDIKIGIWSELATGAAVDMYRRNLQKAYIEKLGTLITNKPPAAAAQGLPPGMVMTGGGGGVANNDIPSVTRHHLKQLQLEIANTMPKTADLMTRLHLEDCDQRIENVLKPE